MSFTIPLFLFGLKKAVPDYSTYPDKTVLGGKGHGLVNMSAHGIPVPRGFIIPCSVCLDYQAHADKKEFNDQLESALLLGLEGIRLDSGVKVPPLLSVRSGARVSMPGMMDTILNVGLTPGTLPHWAKALGERTALDCYRRLLQMFGSVVFGIDMKAFDEALDKTKSEAQVEEDSKLSVADLQVLVDRYLNIYAEAGKALPDTVAQQVLLAAKAVFQSWDNPRAKEYRKINNIPYEWGTAVTVQSMVFGNLNDQSATGVVFTRCPSTGNPSPVGEFLVNAQGEDVVAGIRTPEPLSALSDWNPHVATELLETLNRLEKIGKDMQDVEFTVENGDLYILQTRAGKRSAQSAIRIACDMLHEGSITEDDAKVRVTAEQVLYVLKDRIDPKFDGKPLGTGIAAGGGVVSGVAVFEADDAVNCTAGPCILVRKETDPDDIAGMNASVGILTATGGLTSHAAVVARGMNKSCVVGLTDMQINGHTASLGGVTLVKGDLISIDGATGNVWKGNVPLIPGSVTKDVLNLSYWLSPEDGTAVLAEPKAATLDAVQEAIDTAYSASQSKTIAINTALFPSVGHAAKVLSLLASAQFKSDAKLLLCLKAPANMKYHGKFSAMLGEAPGNAASRQLDLLQADLDQWPKDLCARATVVGDTDPAMDKYLSSLGFKVNTKVTVFEDLLSASGPISVDPDTVLEVFGSQKAYDVAVDVVKKHMGKSFDKAPVPAHWYEPFVG